MSCIWRRTGRPDLAALEKLTWEPGYIVRRALREYAEFERTGVLSKAGAERRK